MKTTNNGHLVKDVQTNKRGCPCSLLFGHFCGGSAAELQSVSAAAPNETTGSVEEEPRPRQAGRNLLLSP